MWLHRCGFTHPRRVRSSSAAHAHLWQQRDGVVTRRGCLWVVSDALCAPCCWVYVTLPWCACRCVFAVVALELKLRVVVDAVEQDGAGSVVVRRRGLRQCRTPTRG